MQARVDHFDAPAAAAVPDSTTDDDLIAACRRGDARAWNELVDRYERLVYSIPLNNGLSRDDAADIAQTTFTILLQSLDNLHAGSRLAPWLATVARRHTWRLARRRRREPVHPTADLAEEPALHGSVMPDEDRSFRTAWLHDGLAHIGERCRALLLALYFDDDQPAYDEIAARFGMRVGSIGPTRARCLARLREVLGDWP